MPQVGKFFAKQTAYACLINSSSFNTNLLSLHRLQSPVDIVYFKLVEFLQPTGTHFHNGRCKYQYLYSIQ